MARNDPLIICEHCDGVYEKATLAKHQTAVCQRCGGVLQRYNGLTVQQRLALTFTAALDLVNVTQTGTAFGVTELDPDGYRPGQFLRMHDDKSHDEDRAFAYVINLGRNWEADWGGLLQFVDDRQNVVETFTPHWNSLSLFRVPQAHQVSQVAPWAGDHRYSITGWFRQR